MTQNDKYDMILSRASVRRFKAALTAEETEALLRAAMSAPTAMDFQPWHFVVVNDNATKDKLRSFLPYAKILWPFTSSSTALPHLLRSGLIFPSSSLFRISNRVIVPSFLHSFFHLRISL